MIWLIIAVLAALGVGLLWGDWVGARSVARIEEQRREAHALDWAVDDPRWGIYQKLMDGELGPPIR